MSNGELTRPGSEASASEVTREAQAWLARADLQWKEQGAAEGWTVAIRSCDAALGLLGERVGGRMRELRARAWLKRGQILESRRTPEFCVLAARSHEAGLAALGEGDADDTDEAGRDESAGESEGRREFEVRRTLMAQLWMNRGNALVAGGGREATEEALSSYEKACQLIDDVCASKAGDAGAERWAMAGAAWLNRAVASHAIRETRPSAEDFACLEKAVALLSRAAEAGHAAARRNLAGAWLNGGLWREAEGALDAALAAWREAVRVAEPEARRDAVALEAGLQARNALCVALARRRSEAGGTAPTDEVNAAELFELVEGGLTDHGSWALAPAATREPAARLFEFGAWLYRTRAPGKLAAFLARHARRDEPRRVEAARVAVQMARQEILAAGFAELLSDEGRQARARLQELGELEKALVANKKVCLRRADTP